MIKIFSLIVAVVLGALVITASRIFENDFRVCVVKTLVLSLTTYFCCRLTSNKSAAIAMFCLFAIVLIMSYLAIWWNEDGSTIKEMAIFIMMDFLLMLVGNSAACRIVDLTSSRFLIGFVKVIPDILFIASVAFFIYDRLSFMDDLKKDYEHGFDPEVYLTDEDPFGFVLKIGEDGELDDERC